MQHSLKYVVYITIMILLQYYVKSIIDVISVSFSKIKKKQITIISYHNTLLFKKNETISRFSKISEVR